MAVTVAAGRENSKRSVVAAAGVMVVRRRGWIGMELKMGAESPVGRRAHGGAATPENWEQMSGTQRQKWHKHRRKKEIKARAASMDLSRFVR